ncbi:GNAT family N-acetyltransferase [Spongiactinospora sp. 9N601]|uniref:GNAT family N-acetyltransferase n=1 Tax=Spongiactinospora sp. 9N601 TaxID=3375149 RepID=UPI003798F574
MADNDPWEAAGQAAADAGVTIRELHDLDETHQACRLIERVWRTGAGNPLMTPELLRVLSHSGGYGAVAYEGERMVGVSVGLLATVGLHSHITAVEGTSRGRNVGFALKLHQRGWAIDRGIPAVTWTFDPLVSRNAYFNLAKLGTVPTEYLPNFYGVMHDEVNAGTDTDRLLVRWDLSGDPVRVPGPRRDSVVIGLDSGPGERPAAGRTDGDVVMVRVPSDIEALRRRDPWGAREWRSAVRDVLGGLMAKGWNVTGFARDGWYVVERPAGPDGDILLRE